MDKVLNAGLLAYGMSGKVFHAPFLSTHKGFNLYAVCERHQKKAANDYPSIISYDSVDDLLADENLDLIIINTPNFTHYEYARKALIAGKHILVEKPFTATSTEAKEIFALAKKVGKKALVYQNRRYDSGFNISKTIIESGKLGKIVEVHFRFDRYRNEIGPKKFKEESVVASGLQYDLGPHLLDQAICIWGKPLNFYKVLSKNRVDTQVDDYFFIHLSYQNDLNVFLTASMLVADVQPAFVINGTKGSFLKNHADVQEGQLLKGIKPTDANYGIEQAEDAGKLTIINANNIKETTIVRAEKGDYNQIFEAVYQNIVNNISYPITEEQIITQLEILES